MSAHGVITNGHSSEIHLCRAARQLTFSQWECPCTSAELAAGNGQVGRAAAGLGDVAQVPILHLLIWSDPCVRIKQGAHYVVTKCGADLFTPRRDNGLICLQLKGAQTQNNLDSIIRRAGGLLRQPPVGRTGNNCFSTTHAQRWISGEDACFINYK